MSANQIDEDVMERTEEESSGGGLGLGLNALFGEEEPATVEPEETQKKEEKPVAEEPVQEAKPEPVSEPEPEPISEEPEETSADDAIAALEQKIQNEPQESSKRRTVGVEQLYRNPHQPRRIFDEETIDELAASIKEYGVLQPIIVRAFPDDTEKFEIIAGERRWRASQKAQLHEVPVIVLDIDELEAFKISLIENLQREDLDPIDEALGYQRLIEEYGQSQEQLSKAVGKSRPHVSNMLRLLELPSRVQAHLSAGDISMGHARSLITADNAEELVQEVIKKDLSVRQTEALLAQSKGVDRQTRARVGLRSEEKPKKDADTVALENDISNALGMAVSIDSKDGKKGKISIEFKTLDQLDEVLHRLAHFPGSRLSG